MEKILLTQEEIKDLAAKIGKQIDEALAHEVKTPVVVVVMKGALLWMAELFTHITVPVKMDYIDITSYDGTESTGNVRLIHDVEADLEGRSVIIVEDIVDTGLSMDYLIKHFKAKNPKRVYVCALLDKKKRRKIPVPIDFVGKELEGSEFVLGFGFDYDELERNVPYVYAASQEDVDRLEKESKK